MENKPTDHAVGKPTDEELEREAEEMYKELFQSLDIPRARLFFKNGFKAAARKYRPEQGGEGKQDVINHQSKSLWEQGNRIKELKQRIASLEKQLAEDKWVSVDSGELPDYGLKVLVWGEAKAANPSMGGAYAVISERVDLKGTMLEHNRDRYLCKHGFKHMAYVRFWKYITPPQTNNK